MGSSRRQWLLSVVVGAGLGTFSVIAVAAPSSMLVAEAIFLAIDRRVWHWNLVAETYRLIDLGVMLALLLGGLALPLFFEKDPRRRRVVT